MSNISIAAKGTFACALIIVFALLGFGTVTVLGVLSKEAARSASDAYAVAAAVDRTRVQLMQRRSDVLEAIVAVHSYETEASASRADRALDDLRNVLAGSPLGPILAPSAERLDTLLDEWERVIVARQKADLLNPYTVDMARLREADPRTREIWAEIETIQTEAAETARAAGQARLEEMEFQMLLTVYAAVILGLLVVATAAGVTLFVRQGIAVPLRNFADIARRLSNEDFKVEIGSTDRSDEIGQLARGLEVLRDNSREARKREASERADAEERAARATAIAGRTNTFIDETQTLIADLEHASQDLSSMAEALQSATGTSQTLTDDVSQAATASGANVESVAAAVEEISISVDEISRQVQNASSLAQSTTEASKEAISKVGGLREKSQKINEVIGIIDQIAGQINLLALNATIESARAGEAGKGFAVVAQQVKELADQTSSATEEIAKVISGVSREIADVVSAIEGIGSSINSVNDNSAAVAAAVEEQSSAISEISSNITAVTEQTKTVAENVKEVGTSIGEANELVDTVRNLSGAVHDNGVRMKGEIERFVSAVSAKAA